MSNEILMMDRRQLIPRWHTSRKFNRLNVPLSHTNEPIFNHIKDEWYYKSVEQWSALKSLNNALDLFLRLVENDEKDNKLYDDVSRYLIERYDDLSYVSKKLINPKLNEMDSVEKYSTDRSSVNIIIRKLKRIVKSYPRDSLSWLDLGFYYSVIGEFEKASRCVKVARGIDRDHPYIARAQARFLVHLGDPEKAIWELNKVKNSNSNPLILSAKVAISSAFDLKKTDVKKAFNVLNKWSGPNSMISELAASIATIDIENGAVSRGKKIIQSALVEPTENVVAHVQWLHMKHNVEIKNLPDSILSIESKANESYQKREFEKCRSFLLDLHRFQPYTAAPIADAGYISLVTLNDPEFVINLSDDRVPYHHMSFMELNNLIVAKVMSRDLDNVDLMLSILYRNTKHENEVNKATFLATYGMYLIALGNYEQGCDFYESSIDILEKNKMYKALCIAKYFFYKQIEKFDLERSLKIRNEADFLSKKHGVFEVFDNIRLDKR